MVSSYNRHFLNAEADKYFSVLLLFASVIYPPFIFVIDFCSMNVLRSVGRHSRRPNKRSWDSVNENIHSALIWLAVEKNHESRQYVYCFFLFFLLRHFYFLFFFFFFKNCCCAGEQRKSLLSKLSIILFFKFWFFKNFEMSQNDK